MARKKLTIDKWYGGISNDPSVGGTGSCFDARGVEVRKDSRKVKMSSNYAVETVINSRSTSSYTVGAIIPTNSTGIIASRDGKLSSIYGSQLATDWVYTDSTYTSFYNLFYFYGDAAYGVVIAANGMLRFPYDSSREDLGALADTVVANGTFTTDLTSWTGGPTDWTWSSQSGLGTALHTAGNTTDLTQTLTVANTSKYIVRVKASCPAGTLTVKMGGTTLGTITTAESGITQTYSRTTAGVSEAITLTPNSAYTGAVDYVKVQLSNLTLQGSVSSTFNSEAVILQDSKTIYIGNGSTLTKVDTSTSSWSSTNPTTVAQGYTIKGLSKVGNQIYIYASNGTDSKQYLWDASVTDTSSPSRTVNWYDKPIKRVLNLNNVDYITTRTDLRGSLYLVNGYQPELLFQSGNIQTPDPEQVEERLDFQGNYINAIETIGNKLLIPTMGGFYSYGNQSPGYPRSLVKEFTFNGGEPTVCYYAESSGYNLYIFYTSVKSGSTKHYYRTIYMNEESSAGDDYSKFDPGFIRLHPFYGTNYAQRKSTQSYKLGAKIPSGTYVNLYSRCDDETGYATFYTDADEDSISTMPTAGATYTNNGNTYTVVSVTSNTTQAIIHCTYTGSADVKYNGTLTKSTGTGDATIKFYRSNEFKLVKQWANADRGGQKFVHSESYNKIEWIVELVTTSTTATPELYSLEYMFDEIETDS